MKGIAGPVERKREMGRVSVERFGEEMVERPTLYLRKFQALELFRALTSRFCGAKRELSAVIVTTSLY
jgi:hypothetical protein